MSRTFDELIEDWTETYASRNSQEGLRRDVRFWVEWCGSKGVDPLEAQERHVNRYRNWLLAPNHNFRGRPDCSYQPASVQRRLAALNSFYKFLIVNEVVTGNPAAGVRSPRVSPDSRTLGLSQESAATLLRAAEAKGSLHAAMFWTLTVTGLRLSELVSIDVGDVLDRDGQMFLAVRIKGGHPDLVRVHEPAATWIRTLMGERPPTGSHALFLHHGLRIRHWQVQEQLHKLTRETGLPPVTPHGLRHTCATLMLDSGASLADVQMQLRHTRIESTLRYDRSRLSRASSANERFAASLTAP